MPLEKKKKKKSFPRSQTIVSGCYISEQCLRRPHSLTGVLCFGVESSLGSDGASSRLCNYTQTQSHWTSSCPAVLLHVALPV